MSQPGLELEELDQEARFLSVSSAVPAASESVIPLAGTPRHFRRVCEVERAFAGVAGGLATKRGATAAIDSRCPVNLKNTMALADRHISLIDFHYWTGPKTYSPCVTGCLQARDHTYIHIRPH